MISDQDITKLKIVFATKDDLKKFATKDDLKRFTTKDEFQGLKEEFADLRVEVGELKDSLEEKFTILDTKLDRFLGKLDSVETDNAAGATILYRHEQNIQALADHAGITLPE
ncbi:MAG: hypothetical protein V4480_04055 [Patescibacteria group bacterium]